MSTSEAPRLVSSMLPLDAPPQANFIDPVVLEEVEFRLRQKGWGGLVSEDRLRRNLLSSQPAAFNVFGFLKHHPSALLAWLPSIGIDATDVEMRIEWAPPSHRHYGGGSAFDAAVLYRTGTGSRGLVGVEVKYAEDLDAQRIDPRQPYLDATRSNGHWRPGAADHLREARLTQLWLNALLAQSCVDKGEEGISNALVVVMACAADQKALQATVDTRTELNDPSQWLTWCPFESLLDAVCQIGGTEQWAAAFRRRYLDFTPVAHLLASDDARLSVNHRSDQSAQASVDLAGQLVQAIAMAERVLGDGWVLEEIAQSPGGAPAVEVLTLVNRLTEVEEALRRTREIAYPAWSREEGKNTTPDRD